MIMFRIRLDISYDGTGYGGFQTQKNAPTIQDELEKALAVIYKQPLRIAGAGRTDAGVHALGQVAHYDAPFEIPAVRLPAALNALLPSDIVVIKAAPAAPDFHARFNASRKIYSYTLDRASYPQVMRRLYSHHIPGPFNKQAVAEAARLLEGTHDFQAFQAAGSPTQSTAVSYTHLDVYKRQQACCITGSWSSSYVHLHRRFKIYLFTRDPFCSGGAARRGSEHCPGQLYRAARSLRFR